MYLNLKDHFPFCPCPFFVPLNFNFYLEKYCRHTTILTQQQQHQQQLHKNCCIRIPITEFINVRVCVCVCDVNDEN